MNILILGAGQVGSALAEHLSIEDNNVTILDQDSKKLQSLQEKLDIRTVLGNASYPSLLQLAGIDDVDIVIAVTDQDEINIIACQIAHSLFRVPCKVARIKSLQYIKYKNLFTRDNIPIDVVINPEKLVTNHIKQLIETPGALQVTDFADQKVKLISALAMQGGALVGHKLKDFKNHMPNIDARVVAIFRRNEAIEPDGDTFIFPNDELFFLCPAEHVKPVLKEFRLIESANKKILIAGGGNIGSQLASILEDEYRVKIIEHNPNNIDKLASNLNNTIILHGESDDRDLLINENIHEIDVFCAVTNKDENNILSCMLAKKLGVKHCMALVNKLGYIDIIEGSNIDVAISPQQTTIGSLLTSIRGKDVIKIHPLRKGATEAIEVIAKNIPNKDKNLVGKKIKDLNLPKGTIIGALVRNNEVIMGHNVEMIHENDHLIIFLLNKEKMSEVIELFDQ